MRAHLTGSKHQNSVAQLVEHPIITRSSQARIPLKSVNDKYSEWHEEMTFITRYVCISFSFKRFESVWLSVLASVVPGSKYLYLT